MKKIFCDPELEIIKFIAADIITASGFGTPGDNFDGYEDGDEGIPEF